MNIPECVSQMLLENETVLWNGRPEPFSLEDSISKRKLLSRIFTCIATFAVLAGVYVLLCHYFAADVKLVVVAFFFLVLAYIACQPIMDRHSISKNCKYFLTEQRVIVVYNEIRTGRPAAQRPEGLLRGREKRVRASSDGGACGPQGRQLYAGTPSARPKARTA